MKEETTSRLEQAIQEIKTKAEAERFLNEHGVEERFFHEYLNSYIAEHDLVLGDVIERSGVSKNYVYNILNGDTKMPGRDKVIALSIAAGMNLTEVNRTLKIAGHNSLYPKNPRDIYIASCINRGLCDITKINLELEEEGLPLIKL